MLAALFGLICGVLFFVGMQAWCNRWDCEIERIYREDYE